MICSCRRLSTLAFVLTLLASLSAPASGWSRTLPAPPRWVDHPKVEPGLQLMVRLAVLEGDLPAVLPVVAELAGPPDPARILALRLAGAEVVRAAPGVMHVGPYLGLRIRADRMAEVLALPDLLRIDAPVPPLARPDGEADTQLAAHRLMAERLGYRRVANVFDGEGRLLRGEGVKAAVVDFNLDPLHPALYHADGGVYAWVDLNDNGRFDPGADGVDLDGDGSVGAAEILQLVEFPVVVPQYGGADSTADGELTPGFDYLYLDTNENGQRDSGRGAAVVWNTPGLAEPTFVVDDVDGNGALDPGERLFRLGSPKVQIIYDVAQDKVYIPGEQFSDYLDSIRSGQSGQDIEFHGTYECTRVAGGHAEVAHVGGIAPAADLVFIDIAQTAGFPKGDLATGLSWLREQGGQAFNYAFGSVVSQYADGSSILELTLTELRKSGALQSASAGNDGGSPSHGIISLVPGEERDIPIEVGFHAFRPRRFFVTLRWRGSSEIALTAIVAPGGVEISQVPNATTELSGRDVSVLSFGGTSFRKTKMLGRGVMDAKGDTLPSGDWILRVRNKRMVPVDVDIWLSADLPVPLARLKDQSMMSSRQTVSHPATADDILAVGACSLQFTGKSWSVGPADCGLAPYSSVGPRIDGVRQVALVAPTDLLAGYPLLKYSGGFLSFGGTSGASPHVTGTIALILQTDPTLGPEAQEARVLGGLRRPSEIGALPSIIWGDGILDTWSAVLPGVERKEAPEGAHLVAQAAEEVPPGSEIAISAELRDQDGPIEDVAIRLRADVGYDGSWDLGPGEVGAAGAAELRVNAPDRPTVLPIRLQAVDGRGNLWNALVLVRVREPVAADSGGASDAMGGSDGTADAGAATSDGSASADPGAPPPGGGSGSSSGCSASPGSTPVAPALLILLLGLLLLLSAWRRRSGDLPAS